MNDEDLSKKRAAIAALDYIEDDMIVGVGTGSTTNLFIDALASIKSRIEGAVASSKATEDRLKQYHIPVLDLNSVFDIPIYVDGADEANHHLQLIKGGGGALTREKIVASCCKKFICIAQARKCVDILGEFPVAVEVISMARSFVAREIVKLKGDPVYREDFVTDNGNHILDVYNLKILQPLELEQALNNIPGVICNGIFAQRRADVLLLGSPSGVETLKAS